MSRVILVSLFGLTAAVVANAGSVQIGGASGITANYINQGTGAVCAAGAGNCVSGSTTGWAERNYNNILFAGATSNSGATSPSAFTGYQQIGGEAPGLTATDGSGTNFAMLSDGTMTGVDTGPSNNYWESTITGGASASIVVPIGLYGVSDVWTMLNNQWGTVGGNDTTVTFTFGSSSNATSGLTNVAVALTNSPNVVGVGQIRSAVACNTVTTATCNLSTNTRSILEEGAVVNGVTINTGLVYGPFAYTAASPTGFYAGTQGHVKLDDQQFVFDSALANDWLVSMTVTENVGNTPASVTAGVLPSETALSAVTVDTVPEPTTILLVLSGLGVVGFRRLRRN